MQAPGPRDPGTTLVLTLVVVGEHGRRELQRLLRRLGQRRPGLPGRLRKIPAVHEVLPEDHAERHITGHGTVAEPQRPAGCATADRRDESVCSRADLGSSAPRVGGRGVALGAGVGSRAVRIGESRGEGDKPAQRVIPELLDVPLRAGSWIVKLPGGDTADHSGKVTENGREQVGSLLGRFRHGNDRMAQDRRRA